MHRPKTTLSRWMEIAPHCARSVSPLCEKSGLARQTRQRKGNCHRRGPSTDLPSIAAAAARAPARDMEANTGCSAHMVVAVTATMYVANTAGCSASKARWDRLMSHILPKHGIAVAQLVEVAHDARQRPIDAIGPSVAAVLRKSADGGHPRARAKRVGDGLDAVDAREDQRDQDRRQRTDLSAAALLFTALRSDSAAALCSAALLFSDGGSSAGCS